MRTRLDNPFYQVFRVLGTPIFKLYYNPKIVDRKNIPKKGPFILCGNHRHFMDQFPVVIAVNKTIHWMSKKEYFDGHFKWFFKLTGCISVDRNKHDGSSKKVALSYLNDGGIIGMFPEGTRNKTKKALLPFKKGAIRMAKEAGCPIIPFAVNGDFKFRSKNLIVRFGTPIIVDKNQDTNQALEKLKNAILSLQNKNYEAMN